jgi:SAM-dependent methyltransferase
MDPLPRMTPDDELPCTDARGVTGSVRSWSEDVLSAWGRSVWTSGDFVPIATSYAAGADAFVDRLQVRPQEAVLDVASGSGALSIRAALAGARVTGIDLAPYLVANARHEARVAGCEVAFNVGDAEGLAFLNDRFDTTMSMFGASVAPRPERVVAELLRVTRPGGRVALAVWTPDGFGGQLERAHTALVPPPAGAPSPLEWGREDVARTRFGNRVGSFSCTWRTIELRFPFPPPAVTELYATCYGPTIATLRRLDPDGASLLRHALTRLFHLHNAATDGTTVVAAEFLDIQARKA